MSGFAGIWAIGPTVVGDVLGTPFAQYRPTSAVNPIGAPIAKIPVWVTGDAKLMAVKAFDRKKPDEVYAGLDPDLTQVGDYLVGSVSAGAPETFFVASQDVPMPIRLVYCNSTLTIYQPNEQAPGPGYYGGNVGGLGAVKLTAWPVSIVLGTKGEAGATKLPGDVRSPWYNVMLPAFPGVDILTFDIAEDQNGVRYIISATELTTFGWRLTLSFAGT
jgi:hypothetical protein